MAACSGRNPRCNFIPILLILACITLMFPPASAADPFTDPGRWEYFNLTTVYPALKAGFAGGIAHGNYVYYVPYTNTTYAHGWTVRYDTTKPFTSASSWEYINLQTINGSLRYFFGGTAHGNYVYYVPSSASYGWTVARYDTTQPFTSPSAWSWFNLSQVDVNLRGFCGATVSGDSVYLAPHYRGGSAHGTVVRYDTTREFTSPSAWSSFDMTTVNAGLQGYEGAVAIGDRVYFIPFFNTAPNSLLARYNTTMGFTDPAAWSYFDTATVESHLAAFEGGAAHGGYLFLTPSDASTYSLIAGRYDSVQDLTSPSAYSYFNLSSVNPNLGNYLFSDALGDFVYYAPYYNAVTNSGWAARYNTSQEFTSPQAWSSFNMTTLNGTLAGFFGCVGSGNHVYFVPNRGAANYPGMTARFYALTAPGASFTASPLSGTAPLAVTFTDSSILSPASWAWDFGDGNTSTSQSPTHIYEIPGTYSVSLTVTNAEGTDTMTRAGSITVSMAPPVAAFTAGPLSGTAPLAVAFIDQSTGSPASWSWDFGDGESSTLQSPSHTYGTAGTYNVSLTATNAGGSDTMTRSGYIAVSAPAQTGSSGSSSIGATAAAASGRLSPGEVVTFTFPNPTIPIRSVTFMSSTDTGEVLITAIERSIPAGIPPPKVPVYKYVDIQTYHLPEDAVTNAVISFQVPRSWISSQDAEPGQVVLLRYHADAWDELPTELIGAGNGYLQFRSPAPGFSLFAIGLNQSRGTPEAVMTATTVSTLPRTPTSSVSPRITPATPEAQPSSPVSLFHTVIIIAGIVVLAVVGLILLFTFSRSLRSKRGGWL